MTRPSGVTWPVLERLLLAAVALPLCVEAAAQVPSMARWAYEDERVHVSLTLGGRGHCAFAALRKDTEQNFITACSVVPDSSGGAVELRTDGDSEPVVIRYVASDDTFVIAGAASRPLKREPVQ